MSATVPPAPTSPAPTPRDPASRDPASVGLTPLEAAYAMRRSVLGDAYVDAVAAEPGSNDQAFQDHITEQAWSVWARPGPLSLRDRSLAVLAMTAATGRMDEFALHARAAPRAGVSDAEIDELTFQIAAYCGAPAGIAARRVVRTVRTGRDRAPEGAP